MSICDAPQARGNILKVDRHKYVKLAYHGFSPLSPDDRKSQYNANYQVGAGSTGGWDGHGCCWNR